MPSRIDRSVMHTMSGAGQSQLSATLKTLGLVSDHGIPTEALTRYATSEGVQRQAALRDILKKAYPYLFGADFEIQKATAKQLLEKFEKTGATGDTIRKAVGFFMAAAKDAGLALSPFFSKIKTRGGGTRKRSGSANQLNGEEGAGVRRDGNENPTLSGEPMAWAQLLLSKFPSFDPAWPDDVKSKWFDAFDRLMKSREG